MTTITFDAWMMVDPEGRILIDTREFETEADVWRIVLGWPGGEEIEQAKRDGYNVVRVTLAVSARAIAPPAP